MTRSLLVILLLTTACSAGTEPLSGADAGLPGADVDADAGSAADAREPADAGAPDALVAPDARAAPDAAAPDALVASDAALPTTGCFAGEIILETSVAQGGGRAHVDPLAIVARDDGWIVFHRTLADGARISFLDVDGRIRASEEAPYFIDGQVIDLGASLALVTDSEVRRLDLGMDRIERQYVPVSLIGARTVVRHTDRVLRALTTPDVAGRSRLRVTELALDDQQISGFVVREGLVPAAPELGTPAFFQYFVAGDRVRMLGTGSTTSSDWRALEIALSPAPIVPGQPVGWQLVSSAAWPIVPPDRVVGVSGDGRWSLLPRIEGTPSRYVAYLVPLPSGGGALGLRTEGSPQALVESVGHLSLLLGERLVTLRTPDLAPAGEVTFQGSTPLAAQRADRAAVIYAIDPAASVARLAMRCLTLR